MINAITLLAERKIAEAIKEGSLDQKAWRNKPLPPDNHILIPPELRMAYKVLKNAGFVPPELEVRQEIHRLEELIAAETDEHTRLKQLKKLEVLTLKINATKHRALNLEEHREYHCRVVEKISVR